MGIRARLEKMDLEKDARLKKVADEAEAAVEKEMSAVSATLQSGITQQQEYLESREAKLEKRATDMLRKIITGGAEGD